MSISLYYGCRYGKIDIVRYSLNQGAVDINDVNVAMCRAIEGGYMDIVVLLLEHGANDFNEFISCAAKNGQTRIVELMLEKADNIEVAMYKASKHNHTDIVNLLVSSQ